MAKRDAVELPPCIRPGADFRWTGTPSGSGNIVSIDKGTCQVRYGGALQTWGTRDIERWTREGLMVFGGQS